MLLDDHRIFIIFEHIFQTSTRSRKIKLAYTKYRSAFRFGISSNGLNVAPSSDPDPGNMLLVSFAQDSCKKTSPDS